MLLARTRFSPLDDYKKIFQSVAKFYDVSFKFADEQITNQHVLEKITPGGKPDLLHGIVRNDQQPKYWEGE